MPARGRRRGGGFPIWLGILLLIGLGVILWLFLKGDVFNDAGSGVGSTTTGTPADSGDRSGPAGTLTIGDEDLLGVAGEGNDALVDREGGAVTASAVTVQSVVSGEAFWLGTSAEDRVLVSVVDAGEAPAPDVNAGDEVSFLGTLEPVPMDFTDRYDITDEDDAGLLLSQGHLVEAQQVSVAG